MTSSWQSRDLDAIYGPYRKRGPDSVSQVLYALLTSTLSDMFGRQDLNSQRHHGGDVLGYNLHTR